MSRIILNAITIAFLAMANALGQGVVGTDSGWPADKPIPEEFRVKRETVYEFSEKPVIAREGDKVNIRFTSKGFCDVTVTIEDGAGRIVRHLVSGVLGPKAPPPFQKGSKSQSIVWDGKNDKGEYVIDGKDLLAVRVSLGLKPQFERTLLWSPHKQRSSLPIFAACEDGIVVWDGLGVDHLRLFDHKGGYLRTIYPFPANKVRDVKGVRWYRFPQGYERPLKESLYQQTMLTCGVNDSIYDRLGRLGTGVMGLAVHGSRIALGFENLNRLTLEGTSGGLPLKGPDMGFAFVDKHAQGHPTHIIGPSSMAFAPDGKTLYYTGWIWVTRFEGGSMQAVMRMNYETDDKPEVFVGNWSRDKWGRSDNELCLPTSVDVDARGNVYVTDYLNDRVQIFSPDRKLLKTIKTDKPTLVQVHRKTGAIYVFSWASIGLPNKTWYTVFDPSNKKEPSFSSFSPYPECKQLSSVPCPFRPAGINRTTQGPQYRVALDSWASGDEPTFWIAGNVILASHEDMELGVVRQSAELDEKRWGEGIRIARFSGGKWAVDAAFGELAKKEIVRLNPIRHNIQELFVNPVSGKLYVGEADSGPVNKSYNRLIEIDPETGKSRWIDLPFNPEEVCFDVDGLICLRSTDVTTRYNPVTWREVPFDYGEELDGVTCSMGGRVAKVAGGIRMPSVSPACYQQSGISVAVNGNMAVACHMAGKQERQGYVPVGIRGLNTAGVFGIAYEPTVYPGRPSGGPCVHIWDKHGKLIRKDLVPGLPQSDGVFIDKDNNVYAMVWSTRIIDGKRYFNYMTETLVKFEAGKSKILIDGDRADVVLGSNDKPKRPKDLSNRADWVEGAEWFYGGVGFAGFNTPHAGGGCACWYCKFCLDYLARSFVPEIDQYSVAVLDSAGNLITRIGAYGNVDDGVPLVSNPGRPKPRSIGGDEVALFHACYVGTHTDRRLFIADIGNARIVSVKLGYHAEEKLAITK